MRTLAWVAIWSLFASSIASTVIYWPNLTAAVWFLAASAVLVLLVGLVDYVIRDGNAGIERTRADFEARCAQAEHEELQAHWDTTVFGAPDGGGQ